MQSFLSPTEYCDSEHARIRRAVRNILFATPAEPAAIARRCFHWVRDHIQYTLGLQGVTASETLLAGQGSCSNKANLLCALLRASGIPAGFLPMQVRTKEYFGPVSIPRLNRYVSEKSLHVHATVHLEGRWIRIDPSDDVRMNLGFFHLSPTCRLVEFDGSGDAMLALDPAHILETTDQPVPSIDDILRKKSRIPPQLMEVFNAYVDYLRRYGITVDSVAEAEAAFFDWFRDTNPHAYEKFLLFEELFTLRTALVAHGTAQAGAHASQGNA
jgi:transglutaminase-like putative cysteine protease